MHYKKQNFPVSENDATAFAVMLKTELPNTDQTRKSGNVSRAEIHPTAIVHPDAQIHESCSIGPFCTVDKHVRLGPDCRLISHVIIQNRVTAGTGNTFHPLSVIGGIPQDLKYKGEDSELVIGNNNIIRESVTLNIGTTAGGNVTRIGNSNLLMAYVHIAHDSTVGSNVVVGNACQIAGHVVLEDWATIGGVTGVSQYLRVGAHCYIGGCSGVDRDVPPFTFGRGPTGGFEILGINLVGLRRRGFSKVDIAALQEVNRIFFKDKARDKEDALAHLEKVLGSVGVVQDFIKFVRSSQKGIFR
jgi:UDP-N-acetylglucosamine acyltransferase